MRWESDRRPGGVAFQPRGNSESVRERAAEWRWGSVLTFDASDARRSAGRLPQDIAKFSPTGSRHLLWRGRT